MSDSKERETLDLEEEEVNFEHHSGSSEEMEFDAVVAALEELILSSQFQDMQAAFAERHCDKFEEAKEMKLEYTSLFEEYTRAIESRIEQTLAEKVPGFSMSNLEKLLVDHKDELSGEVFDTLLSVGDFLEFKDLMLSFKNSKTPPPSAPAAKAGAPRGGGLDLSITGKGAGLDLCVTGKKAK